MKKRILPIAASITASLLSLTSTFAHSTNVWSQPGNITGVYVDTRNGGSVLVRHSLNTNTTCTLNTSPYYYLDISTDVGKSAYSLVLSAQARNIPVRIMTDRCSPTGYPVLSIVHDH